MIENKLRLGLKENWEQFSLLVLVNAFVGGMIGLAYRRTTGWHCPLALVAHRRKFSKNSKLQSEGIKKVESYYSYTPLTADLAELLISFKVNNHDDYIVVPEYTSRNNLKKFISKVFPNYWRVTGIKREVSFKTLRKTYLTRLTALIGEKAMFVKHNQDKTAIKHYLKKKELLEQTKDVRLYDISSWFLNTSS